MAEMMTPEEMRRTMQFLLENQAAHDARLAEIEMNLNKLSSQTSALAENQSALAKNQEEIQGVLQSMQGEFREGLQSILEVSHRTMTAVRELAEVEARTIKRVSLLENRVDAIENQDK